MDPFDLRKWPGFVKAGGNPAEPATVCDVAVHSCVVCEPHTLFVALPGQQTDGHHYLHDAYKRGAKFAVVQQEVLAPEGLQLLRVDDPLAALQAIAAAYRKEVQTPVLAITGSYGKTLTKDLLKRLLSTSLRVCDSPGSFNSQLGVPLSLLQVRRDHDIALIEAGISEVGEMAPLATMIQPNFAILTAIEGAHLDTMGSLDAIRREKSQLLAAVPEQGWVLAPSHVPLDEVSCRILAWDQPLPGLPHAHLTRNQLELLLPTGETETLPLKNAPREETLNRALKATALLGVESLVEPLSRYAPESPFTEVWTSPLGTTFLNDCRCTEPMAIEQSLRLLSKQQPGRKKIFVFGGFDAPQTTKGMRRHLARALEEHGVDQIVLTGKGQALANDLRTTDLTLCADPKETWNLLRTERGSKPAVLIKGPTRQPLDQLSEGFAEGLGDNRLTVQFDRIAHNLTTFRNHLGKETRICAMVKANAYGTDSLAMAKFLSERGVDCFGVAHMHEAMALRLAGISGDILCLYGAPYDVPAAVQWDIQIAVQDLFTIELLAAEAAHQGKRAAAHLHVDTGMSRLGCRPEEARGLAHAIETARYLDLAGLMTHLACADDPSQDSFTYQQLERFFSLNLEAPHLHTANTAAASRFPLPNCNMARLGLGLFGLQPSPACSLPLQGALQLTSRIAHIQTCTKGERVSYGGTYTAKRDQERIGVVPLGYFDGMPAGGHLLVNGQPAPIVGAVCMDFLMIDLTHIESACEHDPVHIFGDQRSPEILALEANLSPHQLITCLGPRIQRIFRYEL